ncbi:MAG: PAS domain-containing protein [Xanthobacteraceae bacterium]
MNHWNSLRGNNPLPNWQDLRLEGIAVPLDDLSYTQVIGLDGAARYQIQFHGERIAEAYGRVNCVGKFLDEILPATYRDMALSTYHRAVSGGLPVYTVLDLRDGSGRIVHYERLLLPFSMDGANVERILASLETVSPEGAFENRELMTSPARPPAFALCATIQH